MSKPSSSRFSTRLGLLLSVLGIAVGTGNIWRFPRIEATNAGGEGAGAFLVAWVIFGTVFGVLGSQMPNPPPLSAYSCLP